MADEIKVIDDLIVEIVTDKIKEIYGETKKSYNQKPKEHYGPEDFVDVLFNVKHVSDPRYCVFGLGGERRVFSQDIWNATGGAEGGFSYTLGGDVEWPARWKGYKCDLSIDSWMSRSLDEKGYLGEGLVSDKQVSLKLFVKPYIARDILDKIRDSSEFTITKIFDHLKHDLGRRESGILGVWDKILDVLLSPFLLYDMNSFFSFWSEFRSRCRYAVATEEMGFGKLRVQCRIINGCGSFGTTAK